MSATISVIIPVHNGADTIIEQLEAVRLAQLHAPRSEILVVDNRSTDGLVHTVKAWAARRDVDVRLIQANERAGEPYARNIGLAHAGGRFVAYCDADDRVGPLWLQSLCELLEDSEYATGPLDMHSLNPPWMADIRGTAISRYSLLLDTIPYAHGCNMAFRRDVLVDLGGFDERFDAGCDLDIAIRMWQAGYRLRYDERAVVSYRLRSTLRSTYDQGKFYGRYRVAIHGRLAHLGLKAPDRRLIRAIWLARKAPAAVRERSARAKWLWVAGQFIGEQLGARDQQIIDLTEPTEQRQFSYEVGR